MKTDYAAIKFSDAVHALATEPGRIKERLVEAVTLIASLDVDRHVSEDLAKDFNDLMQSVSPGNRTSGHDQIQSTIREMTDQAVKIAEQIMVLALELEGAAADENRR
jgi:hypothetical protein